MLSDIVERIKAGEHADPALLIELVRYLRPSNRYNPGLASVKMEVLIQKLGEDPEFAAALGRYFRLLFEGRKFKITLTEVGIIGEKGFLHELSKRISYKILPNQPPEDTLDYLPHNVFYKSWDHQWVARITDNQLTTLLQLTGVRLFTQQPGILSHSPTCCFACRCSRNKPVQPV